jgi:hypothetical protein
MENIPNKLKLVFFQYKYDENLPPFLLIHVRDHINCLANFFDVTVIDKDCDYQEVCDRHQPDLTLFETGINIPTCRRPKVTNSGGYSPIPKLALHNSDAWCETRAGILSDMDHLGIETSFSISTTAAEHTPEISENVYVWPNFIDPEMYRDYGQSKMIPVLFSGSRNPQYPWRQKIYQLISDYYPSLVCPHRGYFGRSAPGQMMYGEPYARTINASWFVPTCGTVAKEVVRKHFEIPACKACLITEKSASLEAAGFVDMKNCVFADERDVLDKLEHLFQNPDELDKIINAGYQLVRSRHTIEKRDQIFQWFNLHKNLKSNEKIVQNNPFEPLTVVEKSSGLKNGHVICNGLHLTLLRQGDEKLWAGKYEEAEALYLRCLNYMRMLPEPKLRLALCNLYRGNAKMALAWVEKPLQFTLAEYKALDPDPVEWAYFIISLLCLGKEADATKSAEEFSSLHHPELDRTRWAIRVLAQGEKLVRWPDDENVKGRFSIHQMPARSLPEWVDQLCIMLKACRQWKLEKRLQEYLKTFSSPEAPSAGERRGSFDVNGERLLRQGGDIDGKLLKPSRVTEIRDTFRLFNKRLSHSRWQSKLRNSVADALHRLELKLGYFLPYRLSEMRNDEFFSAIRKLTREQDIKTALVIGAASGEGSTEAFLAGIIENEMKPLVFCLNGATPRFASLERTFAGHGVVKCYQIASPSLPNFEEELKETIERIMRENQVSFFDAILIDSSALNCKVTVDALLAKDLYGVRFVVLDDINSLYNHEKHDRLLSDPNYVLLSANPALRNGYAIFKRNSLDALVGNLV